MRSAAKLGLVCAVLSAGLAVAGLGSLLAGSSDPPSSKRPEGKGRVEPPKAAPVTPRSADEKPTDKDKLQGRWQLVDADDSDGMTKKRGFVKHVMVIEGSDLWTESPSGMPPGPVEEHGPFTIEPSKAPKRIDFMTGGKDGEKRLGVYSLDGDKLTICFSSVSPPKEELRPADFAIKPRTGRVLLVYERDKAAVAKKPTSATDTNGADVPTAEGTYYPAKEKTAWVWEETIGAETTKTKVSVTKVEQKDKDRVVTIETDKGGMGKLLVSASGVSQLSEGRIQYDPPIPLLKLPQKRDAKWDFKTTYNRDPKGRQFGKMTGGMTAHGPEEIEVPAGKYRCIRVEWRYEVDDTDESCTIWFAPGIGEVKRVSDDGRNRSVRVLKSFTPVKE